MTVVYIHNGSRTLCTRSTPYLVFMLLLSMLYGASNIGGTSKYTRASNEGPQWGQGTNTIPESTAINRCYVAGSISLSCQWIVKRGLFLGYKLHLNGGLIWSYATSRYTRRGSTDRGPRSWVTRRDLTIYNRGTMRHPTLSTLQASAALITRHRHSGPRYLSTFVGFKDAVRPRSPFRKCHVSCDTTPSTLRWARTESIQARRADSLDQNVYVSPLIYNAACCVAMVTSTS